MQNGSSSGRQRPTERPSGRQFEIAPPIDRWANLREGGGRHVLPLAGEMLDQPLEPRIVRDVHGLSVSLIVVSSKSMSAR